jgi:hypothetical protein
MGTWAWIKLLFDNRRPIRSLTVEGLREWRTARERQSLETSPVHIVQ